MLDVDALRPSPEVRALAQTWHAQGQRVFTCDPDDSPAYYRARALRGEQHEVWSTWTMLETLSPSFNVPLGVSSAYSPDLTMMVPLERILPRGEGCGDVAGLAERLRRAAVAHVISLDPLRDPVLTPEHVLSVPRLAPLSIYVYGLAGAPPIREVPFGQLLGSNERPGRVELTVRADRPTEVIVRQSYARGWRAHVDGRPTAVHLREGWHMAVEVPAGPSRIDLAYCPPGLAAAAAASTAALAALNGLLLRNWWVRRKGRAT
jgi:hypothetical protein